MDLILLVEGTWVWLWVKSKPGERALLYIASILTSFFVATQIAPWFTKSFITSGHAFIWLLDQMQQSTHPVGLVAKMIPPISTSVGLSERSQWIAMHVLQDLFTILITAAIFALFVVVEYLMTAIWDESTPQQTKTDVFISHICGVICACSVAAASVWLLANLSWLDPIPDLVRSENHSLILLIFQRGLQLLWTLEAML